MTDAAFREASSWESWAGESRVNLLRITTLALFYGQHLVQFYLLRPNPSIDARFHAQATAITMLWAALALALFVALRRDCPAWVKYAVMLFDVGAITALVAVAGGRQQALALLYVLVIAAAPLRMSLSLVWASTASAMVGYLLVTGYYAFVEVGYERYYSETQLQIPRTQQAIVMLTLLCSGLLAGQMLRQTRRLARLSASIGLPGGGTSS